jgi:hypothetical protein
MQFGQNLVMYSEFSAALLIQYLAHREHRYASISRFTPHHPGAAGGAAVPSHSGAGSHCGTAYTPHPDR